MSKTRFKRPKNWRSKPLTPEAVEGFKSKPTRQSNRADCRARAWQSWRWIRDRAGVLRQAPQDDNGMISRRTRRSIAAGIAKRAFGVMNRTGK